MTRQKLLAGLTTFAVVCGAGSAAWADPYADSVVEIKRITPGMLATNTVISTDADDGDDGSDAIGAPDFVAGDFTKLSALGFDEKGTADPSDDVGGHIVLNFDNNACMDGAGLDIRFSEGGENEAALVEVSNDGGNSYVEIGVAGPQNNFSLDLAGKIEHFNRMRVTSADFEGKLDLAGFDFDAVECLHSVDPLPEPPDTAQAEPDGCDLVGSSRWYSRGRRVSPLDPGIDVEDVKITSDATSIEVTMDLCGELSNRTVYAVYFDYTDRTNLDDDPADDGPDTLDGNLRCRRTYDHVAYYYRGRERGGIFSQTENSNQLVATVDYADLDRGAGVTEGSEVLMWIQTRGRGYIRDHVPTTEVGDRCSRPQIEKEVFRITLGSDGGSTGGNPGGDPGGNPGGDPGGNPGGDPGGNPGGGEEPPQ